MNWKERITRDKCGKGSRTAKEATTAAVDGVNPVPASIQSTVYALLCVGMGFVDLVREVGLVKRQSRRGYKTREETDRD